MLHHLMELVLPEIISAFEIVGIIIIIVGAVKAFYVFLTNKVPSDMSSSSHVKLALGNALALGLEFKMGAEILKTVLIRDLNEIFILGAIIILRAMLAFLIHWEMKIEKEGH